MRKILLLSICVLFSLLGQAWAQPIPSSPWYYSNGNTAHSKPGVETVVIGGSSQGSLQLYDTTGLNKVTVLTESVLGADFIVTLPISGGCDPSALSDGEVLFVASGACTGYTNFAWSSAVLGLRIGGNSSFLDVINGYGQAQSLTVATDDTIGTPAQINIATNIETSSSTEGSWLNLASYGGMQASPTPIGSGSPLGNIGFYGSWNRPGETIGTGALIRVVADGDSNGTKYMSAYMSIFTGNATTALTEGFRLDSSSRSTFGYGGYGIGFATVDPITGFTIMGDTPTPLASGTGARESSASLIIHADGDSGDFDRPDFVQTATTDFARHVFNAADGTFGAMTNIITGSTLGRVDFQGYAGGIFNIAAQIIANAEGTIASSQVPGRIELWTAIADGTLNNGLRFDSSGRLNIRRVFATADATAPGTFYSSLQWVCGTNAGTVKLTTRAGTSTTAVTLVDNVGGGVNGC